MATTYIVVDSDLNIQTIYSSVVQAPYGEDLTQLPVPDGQNPQHYSPVKASDGTIRLVQDPVKIENWNQARFKELRDTRTLKLAECDWTHCTDAQLSDAKKAEWATYRQALRDLPATVTDPTNVTWPTPPF